MSNQNRIRNNDQLFASIFSLARTTLIRFISLDYSAPVSPSSRWLSSFIFIILWQSSPAAVFVLRFFPFFRISSEHSLMENSWPNDLWTMETFESSLVRAGARKSAWITAWKPLGICSNKNSIMFALWTASERKTWIDYCTNNGKQQQSEKQNFYSINLVQWWLRLFCYSQLCATLTVHLTLPSPAPSTPPFINIEYTLCYR